MGDGTTSLLRSGLNRPSGSRTVRLDGYRLQPLNTVEVLGLNRPEIVLLVVSPHADPDQAHAIMMTAAHPSDASAVESLVTLAKSAKPRITRIAG